MGEESLVVSALEGCPFIASCQGLNLCLGVGGGVYWLYWQKCWYARQGWVGVMY